MKSKYISADGGINGIDNMRMMVKAINAHKEKQLARTIKPPVYVTKSA